MTIRSALPEDHAVLLDIWLHSVRASHRFLTEKDIQALLPIVRDMALPALELYVLCDEHAQPVGFSGLDGAKLEALFLHPSQFRQGGGTQLLQHALAIKGPLTVDVNEQNPDAVQFYLARGFTITGRSPTDSDGRPFPLLHLRSPG